MRKLGGICLAVIVVLAVAAPTSAGPIVLYNSLPSPQPPNVPSLGFQATQTAEFGNGIQLATGGSFTTFDLTVMMSNWALESTYEPVGSSAGFTVPITVNLYDIGAGNVVGSLIGTQTVSALIPWRPEADSTCGGTAYRAADGNCYNGSLSTFTASFGPISVPQNIGYGIAFNTQSWGANPTGASGPYNSLNVALNSTLTPSVGGVLIPGDVLWNTSTRNWYTDGGAAGWGFLRDDTGWEYNPAIEITGTPVPEPASLLLLGTGLVGFAARLRRRK